MLKNISSVISPDLLWLPASMGHGDDLVLVDRNFPAVQVAKQTSTGRLIELPGLNIPQATRAILSLMPLDHFVEEPVTRMRVVDDPDSLLEIQREVTRLPEAEGREVKMGALERFAFYEAASKGAAVVRTSEFRPYGCFLFRWALFLTADCMTKSKSSRAGTTNHLD